MSESHLHINQDSGNTEWWTPKPIIAVAKRLMGGIDIDPACSFDAWLYHDKHAHRYDSHNGIDWDWCGRVWLNHPFSRGEKACSDQCNKVICKKRGYCTSDDLPGNKEWIAKLVNSYETGRVSQACDICFASISEEWFQPLLRFPQFFFCGRINYIDPVLLRPVKGVTKGSAFTYLYNKDEHSYSSACIALRDAMEAEGFEGVAK